MRAVLIGRHRVDPPLILAPMAGVTDKPMRRLCRRLGAGYAVSEMLASDPKLWGTRKSVSRRDHSGEIGPIGVQIAGADPEMLAGAARFNVDQGADIIDINMGCPAKKVLKAWAGSALLEDEALVGRILEAVVAAVDVPVTLKIRTGWHREHRNGVAIARIAESAGVAALAVHGRTRDQRFKGDAEYETIASIKSRVSIPVIANGDITSAARARHVLEKTGCDGLMIGRAAPGRPWIFREIAGAGGATPDRAELEAIVREHLTGLYDLYGDTHGVRVARKHIAWYLDALPGADEFRRRVNRVESAREQLESVTEFIAGVGRAEKLSQALAA
ncbi:MAG TPA: tRNA dihydrouridine synthase DusB [Gammaproteobacteria bacterium]